MSWAVSEAISLIGSAMHHSPTDERLRDDVTRRMRMSPIDQPLMLMELLGR
ncbi:hypothetical protein [Synechococcus sp. 1G10]|uniref:hypothetical protein n=1 Tax=Synechococcus sp. 1G10 TaxID=2025605 RepID=UPI00130347E3|nr:hypothetical protein [Synechococcus sp. 1G10]